MKEVTYPIKLMKFLGVESIILTNAAAGISSAPLSHEEVKSTAQRVSSDFKKLIKKIVLALG